MRQKVYKKDHYENIKMFHDVQHPSEFSAYSIDLNRYFGDRSYPKFYQSLVEHKKLATDFFKKLFEKENKIKGLRIYEESFDINKFKKSLKKLELKETLYNQKLKNPFYERISNHKNFLITDYNKRKPKIIKPYCPEVPEVGRYSPSYDVINKHVYEVSFSKIGRNEISRNNPQKVNNSEGKKYFNNLLSKKPKDKTKERDIYNNRKYMSPISNSSKKRYMILTNSENKKKLVIKNKDNKDNKDGKDLSNIYRRTSLILNKFKDNHCLKFENYTSRQSSIRKISYNTENDIELPNYYTQKYIKGNIDFEKISSNKNIKSYFDEVSHRVKNPPLGFYQPKYDSVMSKTRDIYFVKKALPTSRQKQFKKIIYSYDVPYNYQIAPSLNERTKPNVEEYYNVKIE
jgi:hypothetical protein